MKKTFLSLLGLVLVALTMSFRAPESVQQLAAPAASVSITSTHIWVNPNDLLSADHVVVTLRNPLGVVVDTRNTTPGQSVSFAKPSSTEGYSVRSEYFNASHEFIIGDDTQM